MNEIEEQDENQNDGEENANVEEGEEEEEDEVVADDAVFSLERFKIRSVVGALLLPVISAGMGSLLSAIIGLKNWTTFNKNIFGGCLFILLKDLGNSIYLYQKFNQYQGRLIKNYSD